MLRAGPMPLYRILVQRMDNYGLRYPHSRVRNEVCINKDSDQHWFIHRRWARVREVFRLSSIKVAPVPFNPLKIMKISHFCIELNGDEGVLL